MSSARLRPTLYTTTKALSNTYNPIKKSVGNGRVLDVVTYLFLKINIYVVKKDHLARLHVLLGRWISHLSCFCIQTIGDSSRRGCLVTTATVLNFL